VTKQYRSIVPTRTSNTWGTAAVVAGAALAASFFYVRHKTKQVERDHPPQGKFVEVDGVRLHYTDRGEGPPLVLLHGNGVYSSDFETSGLAGRAAQNYRVITFDRPGFGYSERPRTTIWNPENQARLLHRALQLIGVEQPIIVGHSWGTMVALQMGLDVPDDVRGLVLLSGYYYPSMRLDVPLFAPPAIPLIGDLLRYTVSPLLGRLMWPLNVKAMFAPAKVSERFRQLPVWMMLRPKQVRASAAEAALMVPAAMKLSKRYGDLKVPATIIAGTRDKIIDPGSNAERLHEELPNSELHLEPGVGHMTHYAHPDEVMKAVDAIAAQVGTSPVLHNPRAEALARASESGV
jgi:pimeloyl-ACP methyl ester carboxylesterase